MRNDSRHGGDGAAAVVVTVAIGGEAGEKKNKSEKYTIKAEKSSSLSSREIVKYWKLLDWSNKIRKMTLFGEIANGEEGVVELGLPLL